MCMIIRRILILARRKMRIMIMVNAMRIMMSRIKYCMQFRRSAS